MYSPYVKKKDGLLALMLLFLPLLIMQSEIRAQESRGSSSMQPSAQPAGVLC